ncbi:MAG: acetyl-CoA carboxylase biotin carboxyl carrier protein [Paenibacillaceae bacterium]
MFKLSEIKELIKLIDQSSLQELEIQNEGSKLLLRKPNKTESVFMTSAPAAQYALAASAPVHAPQAIEATIHAIESQTVASPVVDQSHLHPIVSPMVGTFYHAPSPEANPFVKVGDKVKEKTVVCIVEAMKLMNDIVADTTGEIVEILVENGQLVEYGQPLFLVKQ